MFVSRESLKQSVLFKGDTYVLAPVLPMIWRWQVTERLGGQGGLAFTKQMARYAARDALRRRKAERTAQAA